MNDKGKKVQLEISNEVHEKIKSIQTEIKRDTKINLSIAAIIENFLEKNKDSIKFEM